MNLHPNGRQMVKIELTDEPDDSGQPRPIVVLSRPGF